jgi:hypothetical protein
MAKLNKSVRQRKIEEQDDRNSRLARLSGQERKRVRREAMAVYCCRPCDRDVLISWETLSQEGGTPKCRTCGGLLQLVTTCLSKGILPRLG